MKSKDNTTNFLNKIIIYPYLKTQNHELSTKIWRKRSKLLHKLTINPYKNFETPNLYRNFEICRQNTQLSQPNYNSHNTCGSIFKAAKRYEIFFIKLKHTREGIDKPAKENGEIWGPNRKIPQANYNKPLVNIFKVEKHTKILRKRKTLNFLNGITIYSWQLFRIAKWV